MTLESSVSEIPAFSDDVSDNNSIGRLRTENMSCFASVSEEFVERHVLGRKGDYCLWKSDDFSRFLSVRCDDSSFAHLRILQADDDLLYFALCPMIKLNGYEALFAFFQANPTLLTKQTSTFRRFVNPKDLVVTGSDGDIFLHAFLGRFDEYDLYSGSVYANGEVLKSTVKRMHCNDDTTRERLLNEFCTMHYLHEKLHNSTILKINAMGVRQGKDSSLMVAYAGSGWKTAAHFIGSRKWAILSEKQKLVMAVELVSALRDMRNIGVIHSKLSLDTIVIHNGRFLITDFSSAIRLPDNLSDDKRNVQLQTEAWGPAQSVHSANIRHLAPETIRTKESKVNTEIYALGTILFQFFSGRSPIAEKTDEALMESYICGRLRPEIHLRNRGLEKLLKRCCAVEPSERPNFSGVYEAMREMI